MQWQKTFLLILLSAPALAGTLHLKTRTVETGKQVNDYSTGLQKQWKAGTVHYLLQFQAPVNEQNRQALAQQGAVIVSALPDFGVVVTAGNDFTPQGLPLQYAGRLRGEDKISPSLRFQARQGSALVEFHPDVTREDAQQLLQENGLSLINHPDLASHHFLVTGPAQRIISLQDWDDVAYIFPASPDLLNGHRVYHCGGTLASEQTIGQYVIASEGWSPDQSGNVTLGYYFSAMTPKVPLPTTKTELTNALTEWTKVAKVQFQLASSASAPRTVNILFTSGDHGDGFPFDGPGGVLGHTFYPTNAEPVAGDMHLDADENWHAGGDIDIYTVALHEAGHALGLGHSDQPSAVMYPYYRRGAVLSTDDITAIQQIYGAPASNSPPPPTTKLLTLTIQTPAANSSTTAAAISLSGMVTNGSDDVAVTWQTDHSNSGVAVGNTQWSAPNIPLTIGTNTITVTAKNSVATATQSISVTRTTLATPSVPTVPATPPTTGDTVAPVLTIRVPQATITQVNSAFLAVSGNASDNVGVDRVTWQNGVIGTGIATGTTTWNAQVPLLLGTNNIMLRVYDTAGNSSWRTITVVRR